MTEAELRQLRNETDEIERTVFSLDRLAHRARPGRLVLLFQELARAVDSHQEQEKNKHKPCVQMLCIDPKKMAVIVLREVLRGLVVKRQDRKYLRARPVGEVAVGIGDRCRLERQYDLIQGRAIDIAEQLAARNRNPNATRRAAKMASRVDTAWSLRVRAKVGGTLIAIAEATGAASRKKVWTSDRGKEEFKSWSVLIPAPHLRQTLQNRTLRIKGLIAPTDRPMLCPPLPWRGVMGGGYLTNKTTQRLPLVRAGDSALGMGAQDSADLTCVLSAVNALQSTAWKVNRKMLTVLRWGWPTVPLPGFPARRTEQSSRKPVPAEPLSHQGQGSADRGAAWREDAKLDSWRVLVRSWTELAEELLDESFYFPYSLDFRGRVYPIPVDLHPQCNDVGRSLLEFNSGKTLGERGEYWLAIHLANTYGHDKIALRSRLDWTESHVEAICALASSAEMVAVGKGEISDRALEFWRGAKDAEPWQFLAACIEWKNHAASNFLSHLPVAVDGTANMLQHLAALTRHETAASQTNLLPSSDFQDAYQTIADAVNWTIEDDPLNSKVSAEVEYDIFPLRRKLVKTVVMENLYGARKTSLRREVREKFRLSHPAAVYVVDKVLEALEASGIVPDDIREWLGDLGFRSAELGSPMTWCTPSGFRVWHEYRKSRTLKTRISPGFTIDLRLPVDELDRNAQRRAMTANLVHSLDAAHLSLVISTLHEAGLRDFATVHDNFAVHACDVDQLRRVLIQRFVQMHEGFSLGTVCDGLREDHPSLELEEFRSIGDLDLHEVLGTEHAFS